MVVDRAQGGLQAYVSVSGFGRAHSAAAQYFTRSPSAAPIGAGNTDTASCPLGSCTDTVTVNGEFLSGVTQVLLSNPRYAVEFPVAVTNITNTSFQFVPNNQTKYPAGVQSEEHTSEL